MLYSEIIAGCSQIHTKHINTLCGQNVEFVMLNLVVQTRCDNLIPGMALWKHNLLTCALAAAVAFEILSLWSYVLRETMVPLPETVLKIVFRNTSQ